jgi:shikimate kinase
MKNIGVQNIFLTGFMGAGKSTVGHALAKLTGCPFYDLDSLIVEKEQRPIAEIFKTDGEEYFRNCETTILSALNEEKNAVYATGGGIVLREENRTLMRGTGRIIYLRSRWDTLRERLKDSVDRPLVDPAKGWYDLEQLWLQRIPLYQDADLIVDTDEITPRQVAEKIVSMLQTEWKE